MEADARKCELLPVTVFGRQGLFYGGRIERASVPRGWHMYEIRHRLENPSQPAQIGKMAVSQFYGTVLTKKAIRLMEGEWDFRGMGNGDLRFLNEKAVTVKEYEKRKQRKRHGK